MTRVHSPQHLHGPSAARVAAWSGALAVHLVALSLLLLPIARPLTPQRIERALEALWIEAAAPIELQPVPPVPPPPTVPVRRQPARAAVVEHPASVSAVPTPSVPAAPEPTGSTAPATPAATGSIVDRGILAYIAAPPPAYPRDALRKRQQGTVLLQVLVDADGRPREVALVRSSGHPALDQAARRQVLEHWRFRPALRDGVPVAARGLVPVQFAIGDG